MSSKYENKNFLKRKREINVKEKESKVKKDKDLGIIKVGPWDEKEDKILENWVKENGPRKWVKCAKLLKERTGKQCREHWNNNLKSNLIKGQWSAEEDLLIMKFYAKYKSWRKIIPIFKDRAENSIKNRFFSELRKIAIRNQEPGKKEYGIKIKLERLTNFIDEATKAAEERYFNENKNMTKKDFDNFINKIEEELNKKNKKEKGIKYIDLESLKKKVTNTTSTIIYPKIVECAILISDADEKLETNKNEKVEKAEKAEKTEKIEKFEKSKSFNDINNYNYLKVPKHLPKLNSFLNIKKGLEKDNKQKNLEPIKEEACENKNSENNSSINSEEVEDSRPFEPKGKGNNSGFETFLQTTRNIEEIKKGKKLSILTIKN